MLELVAEQRQAHVTERAESLQSKERFPSVLL